MIVIHIDTQKDTSFLKKTYEGIDNLILLYNPTKKEINETLEQNPTEDVMMLGHGGTTGLFGYNFKDGYAIDSTNVHLLKDRNCIAIWCYAKEFGRRYGLKGYFTSMFISNVGEARSFGYKAKEEDVYAEVQNFSTYVNMLIKDKTPYNEWVEALQGMVDMSKDFVNFNYSAMEYFDGTQKWSPSSYPYYGYYGKSSGSTHSGKTKTYPTYYDIDADMDYDTLEKECAFDDFCIENEIEGKWARDIAKKIFYAGWDASNEAFYGKF